MSALPIYPKISVHYPSQAFFAQEATVDAQKLVGTYNYPTHFEISLGRSVPNGNEVYKACPGQDVFHAFLMGRIKQLDFHVAEQEEAGLDTVCRVTLEVLDQASDKIKAYFTSDVNILHDVMLHEDQTETSVVHRWAERGPASNEDTHPGYIYFTCGNGVKVVNGPFDMGARVLVDVTFHRDDFHENGKPIRIYHIIAHEIECLSSSFLIDIGAAIPTHMANEDTLEKSVRAMTIA